MSAPFTLVVVALSFTQAGGTTVGVRNEGHQTAGACHHELAQAKNWYASKPATRLLHAECYAPRAEPAPPVIYREKREYREWRQAPPQQHYAPPEYYQPQAPHIHYPR